MLFLAIVLDKRFFLWYYVRTSRHIITEYLSKNGIWFHHSVSTHESAEKDVLRPESHQLCEIILLLSGSVKYKVEGQYCKLSPLDAIVIQPNQLHSREIDTSIPYERMVLHFAPDLLPSLADLSLTENFNSSFLPQVLPKKIIEKTNFIELMRGCEQLCKHQNRYTDLRFIGMIMQVIETLNEIILTMNEEHRAPPTKVDRISHACIQYANKHLCEKKKLREKLKND